MSLEVRQLNCPNCGAPLDIHNAGRSQSLVCPNCGSQIDLTQPPYQIIGRVGSRPPPIGTPFQLGMQGTVGPDTYQIIGRVRYRDEDDVWDEWLILSMQGAYRWFSDSEDVGLVLWYPITPAQPIDPRTIDRGQVLNLGPAQARVRSRGSAVIDYLEGELTWRARIGDRMDYAEATGPGDTMFSIEWTPNEVEFFQGQRLDRRAIEASFGISGAPVGAGMGSGGGPPVGTGSSGGRSSCSSWLVIVGVILLIIVCIALGGFGTTGSGGSTGFGGGSGGRSTGSGGSSGGGGK